LHSTDIIAKQISVIHRPY